MISWLIAFSATFALDFAFAAYTRYVQEGSPALAGIAAALIMLFNSLAVMSYIHEAVLLIPVMSGAALGTAAYVWLYCRKI